MLQRHEDADAARRGIDRAGERDDQQHGIGAGEREGDAGRDHQAGGRDQQTALIEPRADQADAERHQRRAEQRRRSRRRRPRWARARSRSDRPAAARRRSRRRSRAARARNRGRWRRRPGGQRPRLHACGSGDGGWSCDRPRWLRPEVGGAWTRSLGWRLTGSSRTTPCAPYATRAAARQDSTPAPATSASVLRPHWR